MIIFDCDIIDTFTGNVDKKERIEELKEFASNLNRLVSYFDDKKISFSFFSTDTIGNVLKRVEELAPFLDNKKINFASQYSDCEKYENGIIATLPIDLHNKVNQIINEIISLKRKNITIEKMIYAEDSEINQQIIRYIINKIYPEIELISLIPGCHTDYINTYRSENKGMSGLNECMQNYIYDLGIIKRKL